MPQKAHPRKKPKPPDTSKWELPKDPTTHNTAIFVRPYLDEYGLDAQEFRVLAHVARRDSGKNGKGCFESQQKMAEFCGINQRKVMQALKTLCQANILRVEKNKKGRSNVYRLNKASEWVHPSELEKIRKGENHNEVVKPPEAILDSNLEDFWSN